MEILCIILIIYLVILVLRAVASWIEMLGRIPYRSPLRTVIDVLHRLTDPLLRPIGRVVPPLRMGGMGIDLAFIILFVIVVVVQRIVCTA
jgi:YggT family protein